MKKIYSIRLDQQLAERAKKKAKRENRSFSNYIECLLEKDQKNKCGPKST